MYEARQLVFYTVTYLWSGERPIPMMCPWISMTWSRESKNSSELRSSPKTGPLVVIWSSLIRLIPGKGQREPHERSDSFVWTFSTVSGIHQHALEVFLPIWWGEYVRLPVVKSKYVLSSPSPGSVGSIKLESGGFVWALPITLATWVSIASSLGPTFLRL